MTHFENKTENEQNLNNEFRENNFSGNKPSENDRTEARTSWEPEKKVDNPVSSSNNNTSNNSKKNSHGFLTILVVIQTVLLVFVAFKISGLTGLTGAAALDNGALDDSLLPKAEPANNKDNNNVDLSAIMDDDAVKGDPDAPVTIVEFSDYECPFCERFYSETFGQIDQEYIQTGKVKFVYRDFPLNFHQNAQKAAEAAECAGEQDQYFEMHNLLFEQGVQGGVTAFKQYAQQLSLNSNEFNECLDSGSMAAEVQKDMQDGQRLGIQGTPGFLINGKLLSGAQPFNAFKQVIEQELAS